MSRLIHITRKSRRDSYGFEFKTSKHDGKHVVCNVTPELPADLAGLRNGDLILEINDEPVSGFWHDAVEMKISKFPRKIDLLVVEDLNNYIRERRKSMLETQFNINNKTEVISFIEENKNKPKTFNDRLNEFTLNSSSPITPRSPDRASNLDVKSGKSFASSFNSQFIPGLFENI
jgi:hypothetical protein